jgi:hypothetical protein
MHVLANMEFMSSIESDFADVPKSMRPLTQHEENVVSMTTEPSVTESEMSRNKERVRRTGSKISFQHSEGAYSYH